MTLKFLIHFIGIPFIQVTIHHIYFKGGILFPDAPGISDPCEKEPQDAFSNLNSQQREDITSAAQHTLRLIAFRQVRKISKLCL